MKKRTAQYFKKNKARKIFEHAPEKDLKTFLNAIFELSRSRIVKRDVQNTLHELENNMYKLSA
jgi:hypothetical protein